MAPEFAIGYDSKPDFGGFHDWVSRRFGWRESTPGWSNLILQEGSGDDRETLDLCFAFLVESPFRKG
jgi:hypothetical protein